MSHSDRPCKLFWTAFVFASSTTAFLPYMATESPIQTCTGKDSSGDPCVCLRHAPDPKQSPDEVQRCRNCGHWDTCHPATVTHAANAPAPSKVQQILSMYKSGQASGGKKASLQEAVKETNAGLHAGRNELGENMRGKQSSHKNGVSAQSSNLLLLLILAAVAGHTIINI